MKIEREFSLTLFLDSTNLSAIFFMHKNLDKRLVQINLVQLRYD